MYPVPVLRKNYRMIRLQTRAMRSFLLKAYLRAISAKELMEYDDTMIIAPHPDDEALACGGLISLARGKGNRVSVVFMTDGGASHQGCCCNIPSEELGQVRRQLAVRANAILGIDESNISWLDLCDGEIPDTDHIDFARVCDLMAELFQKINPRVVLTPHFMDVWPDHIATNHITETALAIYGKPIILYYYPVWFFYNKFRYFLELRQSEVISLDIHDVMDKKDKAIKSYMQDCNPICGRPFSGTLPPGFVELFQNSYELFFISK